MKKLCLVVALCAFATLVGPSTAGAQSCSLSNSTGAVLNCNGAFWGTSLAALDDGTALLKVVARDLTGNGVNPGAQNVTVSVCDATTPNDQFGISVFRLGNPKDIQRCVTPDGSNASCFEAPVAKGALATTDTLYVVIDVLHEDVVGSSGLPNARFRISSSGWESLKVTTVDVEDSIFVAFTGLGVCQ
jgi:hypothetical protein